MNFLFFMTKATKLGTRTYLSINLDQKIFNVSNMGSWNIHTVLENKSRIESIVLQLKKNDFKEVATRKECGY